MKLLGLTQKKSSFTGLLMQLLSRSVCDNCDYDASTKDSLRSHKMMVYKNLRHSCDKCQYKTAQKSSLKTHKDGLILRQLQGPISKNIMMV